MGVLIYLSLVQASDWTLIGIRCLFVFRFAALAKGSCERKQIINWIPKSSSSSTGCQVSINTGTRFRKREAIIEFWSPLNSSPFYFGCYIRWIPPPLPSEQPTIINSIFPNVYSLIEKGFLLYLLPRVGIQSDLGPGLRVINKKPAGWLAGWRHWWLQSAQPELKPTHIFWLPVVLGCQSKSTLPCILCYFVLFAVDRKPFLLRGFRDAALL